MSVIWRRMTLSGFGRFRSSASVELDDGVNVFIAPNEAGKSTLVAGVVAILFGLPTSSNPDDFGQARYRNWHDPLRFEGTLEFVAGQQTYRIRRNFASHAVTVSKKTLDGWQNELVGEHNPRAHRRNVRYESFLQRTIGLVSRELFTSTFAFTQPLPAAGQLDVQVQQLVSGAGTGHYNDALNRLVEQGRRLTKFTKAMGLSARDAQNDGELESVSKQIEALQQAIDASRDAVDERETVQRQMADLQAEVQTIRRELEQVEEHIALWTEWRDLRDKHRASLQEQAQLQRAWETFNRLEAELHAGRRRLDEEFPEMIAAPQETGDALDELRRLRDDVAGKYRQLATELAALHKRSAELLAEWRQFVSERDRWIEWQEQLRNDYVVFEEADESVRRHYATYASTKASLEAQVEHLQQQVARREQARTVLAASQARFYEAYGDLDGLGHDAIVAIDERIEALRHRDELTITVDRLRREHEFARRRWLGFLMATASASAVALATGFMVQAPFWFVGIPALVGLVTLLAAALYATRSRSNPKVDRLARQLFASEEKLRSDQRLGRFADALAHELAALRERLTARNEAAAALADQEAMVPPDDDDIVQALAEATAALRRFMNSTEPGRRRFGTDLEIAFERWNRLRHDVEQTFRSLRSFSRRQFGTETTMPEHLVVKELSHEGAGATWGDVAQLVIDAGLVAAHDGNMTIGHLIDAMARFTDEHMAAAVAARAARQADMVDIEKRVAQLTERLTHVLGASAGDPEAAKRRWDEYQRRLVSISGLYKEQAGVLAGQGAASSDDLHERSLQAANLSTDAYKQLQRLVAEHPILPRPDEQLDAAAVGAKLHELTQRRQELLRQQADKEQRALTLRGQLADLTGRNVINIAQAEQELEALKRKQEQLALDVDVVALAFRELRLAADAYQQTHRDRLAERASRYLEQFTGRRRRVVVDEQFRVSLQDSTGPHHSVTQLSQGAQDQLYLALRLAIADLVSDDVVLPLLLDDPFVHCDDERLSRIREALSTVGAARQVVLFAHRDVFADWGRPIVVRLDGETE